MTTINTYDANTDSEVSLRASLRALCPENSEPDDYRLKIDYIPDGQVVEYHSLRAWLDGFRDVEIPDHELRDAIHDAVEQAADPESLTVSLRANHGGILAEVHGES